MTDTLYQFGPIDPDTVNEPVTFDLTAYLGTQWTITGTTTASVSGPDNALTVGTVAQEGAFVTAYLSGGTAGATYVVKIRVTMVDANSDSRGPVAIGAQIDCKSPVPVS